MFWQTVWLQVIFSLGLSGPCSKERARSDHTYAQGLFPKLQIVIGEI